MNSVTHEVESAVHVKKVLKGSRMALVLPTVQTTTATKMRFVPSRTSASTVPVKRDTLATEHPV